MLWVTGCVFAVLTKVCMKKVLLGLLGSVAVLGAQASAVDVTAVTTDIAAQAAPVAVVAGAVLLIHLAVKAFKWIRQAMS